MRAGFNLPYNQIVLGLELFLLLSVLMMQQSCIILSHIEQQYMAAGLIIPAVIGILYFTLWQQFVLRVEVITNSIFILFQGFFALTSFIK